MSEKLTNEAGTQLFQADPLDERKEQGARLLSCPCLGFVSVTPLVPTPWPRSSFLPALCLILLYRSHHNCCGYRETMQCAVCICLQRFHAACHSWETLFRDPWKRAYLGEWLRPVLVWESWKDSHQAPQHFPLFSLCIHMWTQWFQLCMYVCWHTCKRPCDNLRLLT